MPAPLNEGEGHLTHLSEQLSAYVRDITKMSPDEFAELMLEHATPEEQAIILIELQRAMTESRRIISEIEYLWEERGGDVEELRRRHRRGD